MHLHARLPATAVPITALLVSGVFSKLLNANHTVTALRVLLKGLVDAASGRLDELCVRSLAIRTHDRLAS